MNSTAQRPLPSVDALLAGEDESFFTSCGPCGTFLHFLAGSLQPYAGSAPRCRKARTQCSASNRDES